MGAAWKWGISSSFSGGFRTRLPAQLAMRCDGLGHPAQIKVARISSEGSGTVERCRNWIGTDGVYRYIDSIIGLRVTAAIFGLTVSRQKSGCPLRSSPSMRDAEVLLSPSRLDERAFPSSSGHEDR